MSRRAVAMAASLVLLSPALVTSAHAACTRLAFSVNDYGKDGPTRDAKNLLDKYVKTWTSERGIKKYTTGPKDVTCELFLDFIVFDEYTCKASATVCWDGPRPADPVNATLPAGASGGGETAAPAKKAAAPRAGQPKAGENTSPIATGSVAPVKATAAPKASAAGETADKAAAPAAPAAEVAREVPLAPPPQ